MTETLTEVQRDAVVLGEDNPPAKQRVFSKFVHGFKFDPEKAIDDLSTLLDTRVVNIDAKLFEGRVREHRWDANRRTHYKNVHQFMESAVVRRRLLEQVDGHQMAELTERLREGFEQGLYVDESGSNTASNARSVFPVTDTVLPGLLSPQAKQATLFDTLDAHRKVFEAATRNPIGKRICLAGDTPIPLLDGTTKTVAELVAAGDQVVWVYAIRDGMVVPAQTSAIAKTGVRETLEVVLDSGEVVRATHDHPFMLRDGSYRDAGELVAGDSLMPLYRRRQKLGASRNTYESVRHPDMAMWEFTHRMVARNVHRDQFRGIPIASREDVQWHVDHDNDNSLDNRPDNLVYRTQVEHVTKTSRSERNKAIKRALPQAVNFGATVKKLWRDPVWRANQQAKFRAASTPEKRATLSEIATRRWTTDREKCLAGLRTRDARRREVATQNNHKVVEVRRTGRVEPVYDLTVPGVENFAVGQGVFVHNCKIVPQFVISRGVHGSHRNTEIQAAWNEFWKRNRMRLRIKDILRDLVIYGEIFLRYFDLRDGLTIRSIDPSTIWEIVTDPEDIEQVLYYHQQFVTLNQMMVAFPAGKVAPASTLVIRQIPAGDVDHFKINATSHEKRGRSELYAILAWLMRFREFANDRIILNKMRAMFGLDVSVDGGPEDVAAAEAQFATPPGSGSVWVHNKTMEMDFKQANTNANEAKTDGDMILNIISVGAGISAQFLGTSNQTSRAGALIQTEPDVKNFEDYREIVEEILLSASERVIEANGIDEPDQAMEFTFPSIASEDRSGKVKDIALCEAMDYFSKARSATMAAREFDITNFNHDKEQQDIDEERKRDMVMATGMQQVPKIAPAATAPAPGQTLGGPAPGAKGPGVKITPKIAAIPHTPSVGGKSSKSGGVSQTGAQAGFKADLGGRGLAKTKASLARDKFTRGKEKKAIKNNHTSQTPREADTEAVFSSRRGWTEKARAASLMERKRRRAARLLRLAEEAKAAVDGTPLKEDDAA